ncbi:MAG: YHYH protein [Actinobacteria bacterium]|nr:YHYH protein [Actinomycetota bacterium]
MLRPVFALAAIAASGTALATAAVVLSATASSATTCDAALFTIKAGMPGAGAGYADAQVSAQCQGANLVVTSNGMPSYRYVAKTPNALRTQDWTWTVPAAPRKAASTTSVRRRMGTVGFTVTGIPIYAAMEGPIPASEAYGDPKYNGLLDTCGGHTGPGAEYHDHYIKAAGTCGFAANTIVGYAIDGFPIYGPRGCLNAACTKTAVMKSGYIRTRKPTKDSWSAYTWKKSSSSTVLDKCNGRTQADGSYGYHATSGFPYTIGCFRGTPVAQTGAAGGPMPPMRPG